MRWSGAINDAYETTGTTNRQVYSNEANRQRVMTSNKIEMYVDQNYYKIRSGVAIDQDGVTVTGGKHVTIQSGGVFNVDSTNFKISSSLKRMVAGSWQFDDYGMIYKKSTDIVGFEIADSNFSDADKSGIYYHYSEVYIPEESRYIHRGDLYVRTTYRDDYNVFYSSDINIFTTYIYGYGVTTTIRPVSSYTSFIGDETYSFSYGYIDAINTKHIRTMTPNSGEYLTIGLGGTPFDDIFVNNIHRGDSATNACIGSVSKPFEYAWINNIYGAFKYSGLGTSPNLNNQKTNGNYTFSHWSFSPATNIPTGLEQGSYTLEVISSSSYIYQRIIGYNYIYTRRYDTSSSTWSSWYKFTGTAV